MKKYYENILRKTFPRFYTHYFAYKGLVKWKRSYLNTSGWIESLKRGYPCRRDGSELPWMNFSIIAFLEQRLTKDLSLFEYGCGYSTLFFSRYVRKVTSIEHDKKWYDIVQQKIPENVQLIFIEKGYNDNYYQYQGIDLHNEQYDVVIIDGVDRVKCIEQSIPRLSSKGAILLDDSQRERYSQGIVYAKEHGFMVLDFEGLKPTGNGTHRTSIIYRRDNCFGI